MNFNVFQLWISQRSGEPHPQTQNNAKHTPSLELVCQYCRCLEVEPNGKQHHIHWDKCCIASFKITASSFWSMRRKKKERGEKKIMKVKTCLPFSWQRTGKSNVGYPGIYPWQLCFANAPNWRGKRNHYWHHSSGLLHHTKLFHGKRASTMAKPSLFTFAIGETARQQWEHKQTLNSPKVFKMD